MVYCVCPGGNPTHRHCRDCGKRQLGAAAAAPLAREVADFYLTGRKNEVSAPNSDAPGAQLTRADKNKPAAAPVEEVVE